MAAVKNMFIHVPDLTDLELDELRDNLQKFFDERKLEYHVFLGRRFETLKGNTDMFDRLRE